MRRVFTLFLVLGVTMHTYKAQAVRETLLIEADATLLTTTIRIVFSVGSTSDPTGKAGVANLVSELVLRGTKKRTRAEFQQALEEMGAAFGVSAGHDKIVFSGEVIQENTDDFLKLLTEALTQPGFSKKELEALRKETLAEIAHVKNSNGALAGLAMRRVLFEGTPLQYPGMGTLSTVKAITLKDITDYYHQHFSQANLLIGIASSMEEKGLRSSIAKLVKGLPEGTRNPPVSFPLNLPNQPTLVLVEKPNTATGTVFLGQGGIVAQDKERFALDAANFSFGGEPLVSRLFRIIRGQLGYTYSISSTYSLLGALSFQRGVFAIASTPSMQYTAQTIRKTLELWKEFQAKGSTAEELGLAKESLANSYPFDFESADKRLSKRLYSVLYDVPLLAPEQYQKTISSITPDRARTALSERHTAMGWWVTLVAERSVVEAQLKETYQDLPEKDRLTISRQFQPEELIQ